jgi:polyisoprenoid-binding protein YceI
MRISRTVLTAGAAFLLALQALPAQAPVTYNIDPVHSSVSFKIRHIVSKVEGRFRDFSGTVVGDPAAKTGASVNLSIKTASVDTGNEARDKHLKSADFFDVEKYPEITFKSDKIVAKGGDRYEAVGTFTMHGVSKQITVPVTFAGIGKDPKGGEHAGFSVSTTLNRKDYGITFNQALDTGGMLLGEDVEISIELEAVKKS